MGWGAQPHRERCRLPEKARKLSGGACLGLAAGLLGGEAEELPLAAGLAGRGGEALGDLRGEGLRLPDALVAGPCRPPRHRTDELPPTPPRVGLEPRVIIPPRQQSMLHPMDRRRPSDPIRCDNPEALVVNPPR